MSAVQIRVPPPLNLTLVRIFLFLHKIQIEADECKDYICQFFYFRRIFVLALCQMLGYSPYESSLAPIIVMVGAILFAQK